MFISLMLCPLFAWIPLGYQSDIDSIECKQNVLEASFDTNVHVEATTTYPSFPGTNTFVKHVTSFPVKIVTRSGPATQFLDPVKFPSVVL